MTELKLPEINRVLLSGRLTRDPERRYAADGTEITSLDLAFNRHYRGRDGKLAEHAGFVTIVTYLRLAEVCAQYRNADGGSVYFRPMGMALMTDVAMQLKKDKGAKWLEWMARLPRQLQDAPFRGTIWSHRNTMDPKHRVLCRDLLLYMCEAKAPSAAELKQKLSDVTGAPAQLPRKIKAPA